VTTLPTSAPTLTDGVVTLRAHQLRDVDEILVQGQDPVMQQWTTVPAPYERANAEAFATAIMPNGWLEPTGSKGFAIEALDNGRPRFAGTVDFRPDLAGGAEVGFGLAPWARGRGLMARALRLGLSWAWDALALESVHWRANVGNFPSRRVAWACGFRFDGTVRSLLPQRGERYDGWVASLLRGEPMAPRHPWFEAPVLLGERVVLRAYRDDDAPRLAEQLDENVAREFIQAVPEVFGADQAAEWLLRQRTAMADGRAVSWCVADPDDDRLVGSVDLFDLELPGHRAAVGYALHPDARGRGLMADAVRLAVRHAFVPASDGGLGRPRVWARIAARNVASRRVAERVGFRQVGVLRQVDPLPGPAGAAGEAGDLLCYDLLADELVTR
jgi:RimJ/RimL family protein N-acetyltransferase